MSGISILNNISDIATEKLPAGVHGFAKGQEVVGSLGIEVNKKFVQAINNKTLENIKTAKKNIPLSISLYGEITYRVSYGSGFSTMQIPNGNEIGNYIYKKLVEITLTFSLSNLFYVFHDLSKSSSVIQTMLNSSRQIGVNKMLADAMPTELKTIMSTLQRRVATLNSVVANGLAVAKNINSILTKTEQTTNYVDEVLQFIQDAIDNNYLFTININGRIYKNLMIAPNSNLSGSTKYYNKFCQNTLIFKEIDISNLDIKRSLLSF